MIRPAAGETVTRERVTRDNNGNPIGAPATVSISGVVFWVDSSQENWDRRQTAVIQAGFAVPVGSDVTARDRLLRADGTRWDVLVVETPTSGASPLSGHQFGYFVVRTQGVI
ncbi:hypothetical protein ACFXG4_27155 [Nocardia sp. NPDC059246]|uniref:hypothetical protein n=1 Tax=unclassified Nocardia TaxID=2637762 RepID=UPI0036779EC8